MSQDYSGEAKEVLERYKRRNSNGLYSFLNPEVVYSTQERQRAILRILSSDMDSDEISNKRILEVGCGAGGNLLDFLRYGFKPENIEAVELIPERVRAAQSILPSGLHVYEGDASMMEFESGSYDYVYQSLVFSSILDADFQHKLADKMWQWVRPGGTIIWHDFVFDNPSNPEVKGVPVRRLAALFPGADVKFNRVTLAPPLSRKICRIHSSLYPLFNVFSFLRTHVVAAIKKQ